MRRFGVAVLGPDLRQYQSAPISYLGEPTMLLHHYRMRARPHLVEPESCCYSTRPLTDPASRVQVLAAERGASIAFSADLAADLLYLGGEDRGDASPHHPSEPAARIKR